MTCLLGGIQFPGTQPHARKPKTILIALMSKPILCL
jgi:hypothetical protein